VILRACTVCGKPSPESYCTEHKPAPWEGSRRRELVTLSGSAEQARAKRILKRFLYCCHVCGKVGADQVDHVIPVGEGGADEDWNLAPIHAEPCHRRKTAAEAVRARARGGTRPPNRIANGVGRGAAGARRSSSLGEL
jgi:5-methylcytosine-specific restriction endonuclease McrA